MGNEDSGNEFPRKQNHWACPSRAEIPFDYMGFFSHFSARLPENPSPVSQPLRAELRSGLNLLPWSRQFDF